MSRTHPHNFVYLATRPQGGYRVGLVEGRDAASASAALRKQRLLPVRTILLPAWVRVGGKGKISLKDQAEVHWQLAQLTARGVPLVEALDVLTLSVAPGASGAIRTVRDMVAQGTGFAQACQKTGLFDSVTIAVYAASERTGDLAGAARQLSLTARRQLAIRGKVATLLMYPAVVMLISLAAALFLITVTVPRTASALESSLAAQGKELPVYTQVLVQAGTFLRDNWMIVTPAVVALIVAGVVWRAGLFAALLRLLRNVPYMREVLMAQESARFFTVMAAMVRGGIPLADALGVAAGAIAHPTLREQLVTLRTRLIEGGVLRHLIDSVTALPVATRRLLIAAERGGDLENAFETLGGDMVEELERRTARLLAVLEPGLIVMMAAIIGGLLLSIMIPMLNISASVG